MVRKILAVNFGGIGDEILFLPTLWSLKKEYPNASITLALESRAMGIKDLSDIIDDVIPVDIKTKNKYTEIFNFISKAIFGNYDLLVISGANKMMSIIAACTFIPKRVGFDTGKLSQILLTDVVKLNKNQYAGKMYHDLVTPLTQQVTELPILSVNIKQKILNSVLIHPGVSEMSRRKGIIKTIQGYEWAQLIDLLQEAGKHVMIAGGPDDEYCIKEIEKYTKIKNYENLYGKTHNLTELAELISSAEKFVCSDSAPLHIAVGLGVKTYVFFGPTDDKKLIPQNDNVIALKNDCDCPDKPCLWERRKISCMEVPCLKYDFHTISRVILEN